MPFSRNIRNPDRSWFILILTLLCWVAVAAAGIIALLVSPAKAADAPAPFAPAPAAAPSLPPLPQPITSFGAAIVGEHLYIVGGHSGDPHGYSRETLAEGFHRVNLKTLAKWESLPATRKLQGLAAVAHGDHVYRIGGLEPRNPEGKSADLHSVADVARFDTKRNKWEDCTPLPEARSSHDAVVVGNDLIVVGGWKMSGQGVEGEWLTTVWAADLTQSPLQWRALAPTPFKRRAVSVAAADGKVVVIGGLEPKGGTSAAVAVLDLAGNTWSEGAAFPGSDRMKGFGTSAFAIGATVYANGWETGLLAYDVKKNEWKTLDVKLIHRRFFHRLIPHGDSKLLLIGGAGKAGQRDDVDVVTVR